MWMIIDSKFSCILLPFERIRTQRGVHAQSDDNQQPAAETLQDGQTAAQHVASEKHACKMILFSVFSPQNRAE